MSPRTPQNARLALCCLALGASALGLAGCRGDRSDKPPRQFFPDMDEQPRWNPQSESEFYVDGRTMRHPPADTVPFGRTYVVADEDWAAQFREDREGLLKASYEVYDGTDDFGDFVTEIPVPVTADLVKLGQEKFNIYCAVCHGYNAEGAGPASPGQGGMVGRRWSIPVANLHDPMYLPGGERGTDGYLYTVVRHGVGVEGSKTMPGYDYALNARESWAVVSYVRALQASRLGAPGDVPQSIRSQLGEPPTPPPANGSEAQQ